MLSVASTRLTTSTVILVCSPAAATIRYVADEVARFIGLLRNDEALGERAEQQAFPPSWEQALAMPLAADFRTAPQSRLNDHAHRGAWMLLLAS